MAATIEVNKSNVSKLLITGTKEKLLIPEYQRPYDLTYDQAIK